MAKWICPVPRCSIFVGAPPVRPVHAKAPNPHFQSKDPHCPTHRIDMVWTADGAPPPKRAAWLCPTDGCSTWVFAPDSPPTHAKAANPAFQGKDPHCPTHWVDLVWTPADGSAATGATTATSVAPTGPLLAVGTRDAMMGILVGHFGTVPIWCDYHQRKHISGGAWPGDVPQDKPLFLSTVFNQSNLRVGSLLADTVPWARCRDIGGVDIIFDCGTFVVGTDGETDILLQGGFTTHKGNPAITFHAYPVKNEGKQANTFRSAKLKDRILTLRL